MSVPTSLFSIIPPAVMIYHLHLSAAAQALRVGSADLVDYHKAEAQKAAKELARLGYELASPELPSKT